MTSDFQPGGVGKTPTRWIAVAVIAVVIVLVLVAGGGGAYVLRGGRGGPLLRCAADRGLDDADGLVDL